MVDNQSEVSQSRVWLVGKRIASGYDYQDLWIITRK
jgi:hypothetical protein